MHVVFIPYGVKHEVEYLLSQMECQKFKLRIYKKGEEDKFIWVAGHLRQLPFGVWEYVLPKESLDLILNTLQIGGETYLTKSIKSQAVVALMRKVLRCDKIPKYNPNEKLVWIMPHVSVLGIGIREDGELTEPEGSEFAGWTHEAL